MFGGWRTNLDHANVRQVTGEQVLEVRPRHFLPALMGSLHQQKAEGELVLEQNDGTRRLYWAEPPLLMT